MNREARIILNFNNRSGGSEQVTEGCLFLPLGANVGRREKQYKVTDHKYYVDPSEDRDHTLTFILDEV